MTPARQPSHPSPAEMPAGRTVVGEAVRVRTPPRDRGGRDRLGRAIRVVWLSVGLLVLGYAALRVFGGPLGVVVPPLVLAVLIVHLLNPIVNALARRQVPRLIGAAVSYLGLALVVGALVATLTPLLARQLANFSAMAPDLGTQLVTSINSLLAAVGLSARVSALDSPEMSEQLQSLLSSDQIPNAVIALVGGLSGLAGGMLHLALVVLLGPVIAFYLLVALPHLSEVAWQAVPPERRPELREVATQLVAVVGGFVRGQLLVALFVGTAVTIGLALVGLPFWLLIGVVAGLTNIVPLIGPFVAGVLGVSVALFTGGPSLALLVLVVLTGVQQIDNHLVSPLVMGRSVRIHPLLVLLALLVAGSLYGIFGMLLAVPTVAGAKVIVVHLWRTRVPWANQEPETAEGEASAAREADAATKRGAPGAPRPSQSSGEAGEPGEPAPHVSARP